MLRSYPLSVGLFCLFFTNFGGVLAQDAMMPKGRETDAQEIWNKELTIYERRAGGDMTYYLSLATEAYMSWPAPMRNPISFHSLSEEINAPGRVAPGEVINVTKKGISFDGDTALVFFQTHRTQRPGGEKVDERFDNIHVWVKRAGEWRLISNMSRPVIEDLSSVSNVQIE